MDIPGAPAASMPQDPIDAPVPVPPPVVPSVDVDALLNGIVTLVQSLADRDSSRDQQLAALLHVIKESKTDNDAPKPDQFNGRQSQTSAFLFQVNTAIASSPHKYDTCQKKIRFMSSRLKDTALTWYMGLLQRNAQAYAALKNAERAAMIPPQPAIIVNTQLAFDFEQYPPVLDALTTWQGFVSLFQAHFGDPDARATAERKLESLRQVTSVAEYASEYQSYCYELDDTEQRRANGFYKHLKPLVKDEVTRLGKPDTLAAMIALAIQADARLMERVSERRTEALGSTVAPPRSGTNPPRMAPFIMATPPPRYLSGPPSTHTGPVPMQVDAIRTSHAPPSGRPRGPLTASERQRRIELNLCLYCGMPHHRAESCPNRPVNSSRPPSHFVQTSSMAAHHSYAPFPHHTPPAGSETSVLYTLPAGAEQHGPSTFLSHDTIEPGKAAPQQ
ncbi:hypothetical protein CF319_g8281 [Tilletia indica]|nr:hypothetical protein CF319_g8281 [Tilletia indica]